MLPLEVLQAFNHFTSRDAGIVVVVFGLVRIDASNMGRLFAHNNPQISHGIFRRWEPIQVAPLATLLFVMPLALSTLFARLCGFLPAIFLTFITYFIALGTSILVYRLSPFHPLARYPGPLVAQISALWMAFIASRGKRHLYLHSLHEQYGDVVRIGIPRECFFHKYVSEAET